VLVIGNPDGRLPFAGQEAQAIARLYGAQPLLGTAATKETLRREAPQAGIVHIAAHGRYDATRPLASWLALAPDGEEAGQLPAREVYDLDLKHADLVVLSACQTNLGELSAGDEVVGLTRAFLFAGTPTVISSLWSVDDAATGLLMERFYTHLRGGLGKAEALRQAQQDVRDYRDTAGQQRYAAPYYWAGFVLAGDPGPVDQPPDWGGMGIAVVLALVMLGMAGILLRIQQGLNNR
jgi:CHAT domain-containing protein